MARRLQSGDVLEVEFPKVPSPEVAWPVGGYGYLTYIEQRFGDCKDKSLLLTMRDDVIDVHVKQILDTGSLFR